MNQKIDIRNEEILLLGLCRLDFGVELKVMLQALAEEISDWTYFANLAGLHGVAALVYHNLDRLGFLRLVPGDISESLKNSLFVSMSRNVRNAEMMKDVLKILNS